MRKLILLLTLLSSLPLFAQKVKTVVGEFTYHVPENVSLNDAKRTALERAQIQALAEEFGIIVSREDYTRVKNRDGESKIDFISIGGSDVKGEWLETVGEPRYEIRYEGEQLIIYCKVKGKAREIVSSSIDLQAHILRNGIDANFESDHFKNGESFYLSFQSPVKGFLAVYLVDDDEQVSCLLPYRAQQTGIYPIEANRPYTFFCRDSVPIAEQAVVDEYYMTCERTTEHNQFYIIFSPNQFTKATDTSVGDNLPRQLPFKDFQKWLTKCRKYDKKMNVKKVGITIEK